MMDFCTLTLIFIGAGFGLIIGILCTIPLDYYNTDKYGLPLVVGIIIIGAVIGGIIGNNLTGTSYRYEIYSLGDTMGVSGTFVLGTGSINSQPVFVYYMDSGTGGYKLDYSYADRTVIYEDAPDGTGYMIITIPRCGSIYKHDIHIPKGTIKRQFNLDSS